MKDKSGETMVQMEAWDPLNTFWGVSSDGRGTGMNYHGLSWTCQYQDLDSWRLDSRFNYEGAAPSGMLRPTYETKSGDPVFRVYEFYDREFNIVKPPPWRLRR